MKKARITSDAEKYHDTVKHGVGEYGYRGGFYFWFSVTGIPGPVGTAIG